MCGIRHVSVSPSYSSFDCNSAIITIIIIIITPLQCLSLSVLRSLIIQRGKAHVDDDALLALWALALRTETVPEATAYRFGDDGFGLVNCVFGFVCEW